MEGAEEASHALSLKEELQALKFSPSVIAQAEAGIYSPSQLQILKQQKQNFHNTVAITTPLSSFGIAMQALAVSNLQTSSVTPRSTASNLHDIRPIAPPKGFNTNSCAFKCCHRCRPYMIDRCWTSFEAVFAGELRPLSITDTMVLPVKSPLIARTLGLANMIPYVAMDTSHSQDGRNSPDMYKSAMNNSSSNETIPTTTSDTFPYSEYSSSDEDEAAKEDWQDDANTSHYTNDKGTTLLYAKPDHTTSTPQRFSPRTIRRVSGSVADSSPRSVASGSSISLPTPTTARTSPMSFKADKETFACLADMRIKACAEKSESTEDLVQTGTIVGGLGLLSADAMSRSSSTDSMGYPGNEIEVEGGVALTEEAVRTHTPDLITHKLSQYHSQSTISRA